MQVEQGLSDQFKGHEQVTSRTTPQDKINLFMSLFRGRDDIYAKRWQNKVGKYGYSPACLNECAKGMCSKPKVKFSGCANRNYAVLDSTVMDFDDEGWQKDVSVLRDICNAKDIYVDDAIEEPTYCNYCNEKIFGDD